MVPTKSFDELPDGFSFISLAPARAPANLLGPRQMTQEQGRALETLAHAVEYLQDEVALEWTRDLPQPTRDDVMEAIELLKSSSRSLWRSLPVREPFWRRWRNHHAETPVIPFPLS